MTASQQATNTPPPAYSRHPQSSFPSLTPCNQLTGVTSQHNPGNLASFRLNPFPLALTPSYSPAAIPVQPTTEEPFSNVAGSGGCHVGGTTYHTAGPPDTDTQVSLMPAEEVPNGPLEDGQNASKHHMQIDGDVSAAPSDYGANISEHIL